MKNKYILIIYCFLAVFFFNRLFAADVREPSVSGSFYMRSPEKLKKQVDLYLKKSSKKLKDLPKKIELGALIVPHAGYVYSAETASYAYNILKKYSKNPTIILLGSSHNTFLKTPATVDHKFWKTPLGKVKVDYKLLSEISSINGANVNNDIFRKEHSLEVQLPFLQAIYGDKFSIVPILINEFRQEYLAKYVQEISEILAVRKNTVIIMSTDMSHYFKQSVAGAMDHRAINAISDFDLAGLEKLLMDRKCQLCGAGAVMLGMSIMRSIGYNSVTELDYSDSSDYSGATDKVVGYGSLAIYRLEDLKKGDSYTMEYNDVQRKELLDIARTTIVEKISKNNIYEAVSEDPNLKEKRGVFVTLHKNGKLRGCIGNIMPLKSLNIAVRDMAIAASSSDPRFEPVRAGELRELDIEISVLTVPELVDSAEQVELGRDGVIIKRGFRQGVYLPQVAKETGWTKDEFLSSLCYSKAGLPADAWKDKDTEIYTFQAEVFGEK